MNKKILLTLVIFLVLAIVVFSLYLHIKSQTPEIPPSAVPPTNPPAPPGNESPEEENKLEENGSVELEKPPFLK
jgi:hypothetical protein